MQLEKVMYKLRHHWQTLAFFLGFLTDILWLNQVDSVMDNATILFYVFLATTSLFLLYAGIARRFGEVWSPRIQGFASIIMQYSFGGLFSGMLILYGRSGDIFASWPFLILFIGGMVANEMLHKREEKLLFNLVSYFIGVFSYLVLGVPVLTGYMGPWVFVGCGVVALGYMYLLIKLLALVIPNYLLLQMRHIVFSLLGMFLFLNTLYFTNVIPPIPLSIKEIVIAQSVVRNNNPTSYAVTYERVPWWRFDKKMYLQVHPGTGGSVACFARVFAPTRIKTDIVHQWQYKDAKGVWQDGFKYAYPITGEATNGYRGYTETTITKPGTWRCSVETTRGQIIGRQVFHVVTAGAADNVITEIK